MILKTVLKRLLNERGVTVTRLAKATSIPQQTLHNWLSGSEPRSIKQLKKVADYFSVTLDEITYGTRPFPSNVANKLEDHRDEIFAGNFEVILRKIKK